ncbi:aflatoxin regulatory protein-domain-containing protein [Aspergillus egyptiacus]|nr:aflatoxin regulatory protein-domain-containing protein [Aspergillus egyptiacus]
MAALNSSGLQISPTQAPTVKLRGSCHACALSKLKCSQDKPTCARCAKRGTTCQYLASKRAGRKQGSRTGSLRSPIKTDHRPLSLENGDSKDLLAASTQIMQYALQQDRSLGALRSSHYHQGTPSYPDSVPSLLSSAGTTTSATTPLTFNNHELDGFYASPMSLSLLGGPDIDYFPVNDADLKDFDAFSDPIPFFTPESSMPMLEDNLVKQFFGPNIETSLRDLSSSPSTAEAFNLRSLTQCSCFGRLLTLLRKLFPGSGCNTTYSEDGDKPFLPTIQQVITQNERTIQEINQTLNCYGSHDGYTLSVLALAVFKVLDWYGAVANDPAVYEDSPTCSDQIDRKPTIIAGYKLEGEDQGRMAAQLVLSELHRVQRLVKILFQRLKDHGSRDGIPGEANGVGAGGHPFVLPLSLLDHLAAGLRARLRCLSGEIVEHLRRG